LEILGGLVQLILALGFLAIAALLNISDIQQRIGETVPQWVVNNAMLFFGALGATFLIMAILSFVLAWGFLRGKSWARVLAIVFLVISIIGAVIGSLGGVSIITIGGSIVFPVIIVVYLHMGNVREWFTA
jgi:hypothetical protein